jgi:hypothetical protein
LTRISLGPYEEELRQYLLGQTQFPRNAVLAVDVIADAILRRGVIPPFGGKREGGIWSYTLPFFGIVLTVVYREYDEQKPPQALHVPLQAAFHYARNDEA